MKVGALGHDEFAFLSERVLLGRQQDVQSTLEQALDPPIVGRFICYGNPEIQEVLMHIFHIRNMTCGDCAKAVTHAITQIDPGALVEAQPSRHEISVKSSADERSLLAALQQAGYPAMPVLAALG